MVEVAMIANTLTCLSLTQAWATLVILGEKRVETRSWPTRYRGLLGIHASARFPKDARALCRAWPFWPALSGAGYGIDGLPLGALLGTVRLVNCVRTEEIAGMLSKQELAFGDYSWGRWAWVFDDPQPYPAPIPMKGALGLWTATLPVLEVSHER